MPIKEFALRFDAITVPVRNASESDKRESASLLQDTQGLFRLFQQYSNLRTMADEQLRAYMQTPDGMAYLQKTLEKIGKLIHTKSATAPDATLQEIQEAYKMQNEKDLPEMVFLKNYFDNDFINQNVEFNDRRNGVQWAVSRTFYNEDDVYLESQRETNIQITSDIFEFELALHQVGNTGKGFLKTEFLFTNNATMEIMGEDEKVAI